MKKIIVAFAIFCGAIATGSFVLFNLLSGLVAGIWLLILHDWRLVVGGFFISLIMPHIYTLVALPGLGLGLLAAVLVEKGWTAIGSILAFITSLFNYVLLSFWVLLVFMYCISYRGGNSWIPYALWAYSTTLAPLAYMASREPPDSTGTALGVIFAMLSVVLLAIVWRLGFSFKSCVILIGCLATFFAVCTGMLVAAMAHASAIRQPIGDDL